MDVSVTGGLGHGYVNLRYSANDLALAEARLIAASIDARFSDKTATYYNGTHVPPTLKGGGYLIATASSIGSKTIDARGYRAVVIQDRAGATVIGGGNKAQTVLAGSGDLTFSAKAGNTTVVAGGGNNDISFQYSHGMDAAYTSIGRDTILGGSGHTTISAGAGDNFVTIGGGRTFDIVSGDDRVQLGKGAETINVEKGGSATVYGSSSVTVAAGTGTSDRHHTLKFIGGAQASTVFAGAGSYRIDGGSGGGLFYGGSAGDNVIIAGSGSATIFGGGDGDHLVGGSGNNSITAGGGNETLVAGSGASTLTGSGSSGSDRFTFDRHPGAVATTDVIANFQHGVDFLHLGGFSPGGDAYALSTFTQTAGGGYFLLPDGTKVVLDGVSHLYKSDFK
jgi:Ca2+-binding RTX toxin-like protein